MQSKRKKHIRSNLKMYLFISFVYYLSQLYVTGEFRDLLSTLFIIYLVCQMLYLPFSLFLFRKDNREQYVYYKLFKRKVEQLEADRNKLVEMINILEKHNDDLVRMREDLNNCEYGLNGKLLSRKYEFSYGKDRIIIGRKVTPNSVAFKLKQVQLIVKKMVAERDIVDKKIEKEILEANALREKAKDLRGGSCE